MMALVVCFVILWTCIIIYVQIAGKLNIVDKPNERSSHIEPTIRGAGIIFPLSMIVWFVMSGYFYPYALIGILLIASVSFYDDLCGLSSWKRFLVQTISLLIAAADLLPTFEWPLMIFMVIVGVGIINAFNFMDGINGITGVYSLVTCISLMFINRYCVPFTDEDLIAVLSMALCIFLFYNFRKRARCFAGDVGSVSLAFLILFLMLQLIIKTDAYGWILFLVVYGIDTGVTIIYRLLARENIFKAHRNHLYQYMANELGIQHRIVSVIYAVVQLMINVVLIGLGPDLGIGQLFLVLALIAVVYVVVREIVLFRIGKKGLIAHRI